MLELYQAYADYRDFDGPHRESDPRRGADADRRHAQHRVPGRAHRSRRAVRRDHGRGSAACAPIPSSSRTNVRDRAVLAQRLRRSSGIDARPEHGAGKLQIELFEKTVEATLRSPVFVTQYPAEVSPLARCNDADPFVTDRFELFIGGRELANGFSELNDPEDQAARFRAQVDAKAAGRRGGDVLRRRLHPRARVRHAAGRRARRRHRPARDAAARTPPSIRDVLLFPQLKPET